MDYEALMYPSLPSCIFLILRGSVDGNARANAGLLALIDRRVDDLFWQTDNALSAKPPTAVRISLLSSLFPTENRSLRREKPMSVRGL